MERTRVLTQFPSFIWYLFPIFLYAETHYRFRYFFSFLRKREPELIADAPHRLEPNSSLPILILVKDAHLFPVKLDGINLTIRSNGSIVFEKELLNSSIEVRQKLWWQIFDVPIMGLTGNIECDVIFRLTDNNQKQFYHNDNHRTSSHRPLKVFISRNSLPKFEHLYLGECHSHSHYTDDQVEFGSPLGASALLGKSLGLSFFCVTDHSYDLDDKVDNYLINDPDLPKWRQLHQEVDKLNSKLSNFTIIRGEEVTCRNSADQNVHLLLLGNKKFFTGTGDGAEQWLKTRSEYTISDVLEEKELSTLAYAAHPFEPVSFLQRLLLHRGKWHERDIVNSKLSGIQFANGQLSDGFQEGYRQWVKALLQGKRLFVLAGNDAHGNFNRFRQIGIPFFKIHEMEHQVFGKMRTGVFLASLSEGNILNSLRAGMSIITDGPVVNLSVISSTNQLSSIGCSFVGTKHTILLEVQSSTEYGSIELLKVFNGSIGQTEAELVSEKDLKRFDLDRNFSFETERDSYIRAEIWTSSLDSSDGKPHFCLTNPIWFTRE
ncbi:MAG: CehA/McbA family metallohydrolase [Ignavibacteriales bacterium]|nr:CehA/McbA family metallohydrolase [Ignavibacteriales bacterium]